MKIGTDGKKQYADALKINRPDDLSEIADLGLSLAEGKLLPTSLQQEIVAAQVKGHCGEVCRVKDYQDHVVATLFGQVTLRLPRFRCAESGGNESGHDWPIALPLDAGTGSASGASLRSDAVPGGRRRVGEDVPGSAGNDPETVRCHILKIGADFRDRPAVRPDTAAQLITVALNSTFIRSCEDDERHLEVQAGNVETETGGRQVFGALAKA